MPRVVSFTPAPHGVTLKTSFGALAITAVNDHVIRVRASQGATSAKDLAQTFSWAVVPGANAATGSVTVTDEGAAIVAATPALRVRVEKSPLRVS